MASTTHTTSSSTNAADEQGPRTRSPLARAWISIALVPAFFVVAFAAAHGRSVGRRGGPARRPLATHLWRASLRTAVRRA